MQQRHSPLRLALALALGLASSVAVPAWSQTAVFPLMPLNGMARMTVGCAVDPAGNTETRDKLDTPYSAVGTTEVVSTLADGNRITRKNTMRYFRDSRGRTRTELELATLGPVALDVKRTVVTIVDPVAKAHYILHPEEKTAMVLDGTGPNAAFLGAGTQGVMVTRRLGDATPAPPPGAARDQVMMFRQRVAGPLDKAGCAPGQSAPIPLGERVIQGLKTTGSRLETVIAAGDIGNELPITMTTEQWFSPELGVVISSTHHDPMVGDTNYRLTQISRTEPDAKLFTVPADYKRNKIEPTRFEMKLPPPGSSNRAEQ